MWLHLKIILGVINILGNLQASDLSLSLHRKQVAELEHEDEFLQIPWHFHLTTYSLSSSFICVHGIATLIMLINNSNNTSSSHLFIWDQTHQESTLFSFSGSSCLSIFYKYLVDPVHLVSWPIIDLCVDCTHHPLT